MHTEVDRLDSLNMCVRRLGDIGLKISVLQDWYPTFRGGESVFSRTCNVYSATDLSNAAYDIVQERDGPEAFTGLLFKDQIVDSLKRPAATFETRCGEITLKACVANNGSFSVDCSKREQRDAFEQTCTLVRA